MLKYLWVLPLVFGSGCMQATDLLVAAPNSLFESLSVEPPAEFTGTITRKGHGRASHLELHAKWEPSDSSNIVKYEIFEDKKHVKTVKADETLHFRHHLHPKQFFLSGLYHIDHKHKFCKTCWHEYTKFLHKKYRVRAVNEAGKKSSFRHLTLKH